MAGALGVCVAAIFYVLNLRISQRNQRLTLETRQAQFMMQLHENMSNPGVWKDFIDTMNMEWTDIDDFERKWGTGGNAEAASKRLSLWWRLSFLGELLQRKLVDGEWLYSMYGDYCWNQWAKWKPIIEGTRRLYSADYCSGFEFAAEEMGKMAKEKGQTWNFPKTVNMVDSHLGKVIKAP